MGVATPIVARFRRRRLHAWPRPSHHQPQKKTRLESNWDRESIKLGNTAANSVKTKERQDEAGEARRRDAGLHSQQQSLYSVILGYGELLLHFTGFCWVTFSYI